MYDYYILEFHPDHERAEGEGWVPQQIIVMEEHLGRTLFPDEEIKHLNGNPHDNRISNLHVVTPQFGGRTNTLLDTQDNARKLSKNFTPCRFQRECWATIRAPLARKHKIFLPYICDYATSGDLLKCGHYWNFIEKDQIEKVEEGV